MENIKKILVVTLSNIGDVVLTFPVIGALRENFKDAAIDVVAGPRAAELFEGDPRIGKMYVYHNSEPPVSKIRLLVRLRRNRYDLLIDLRSSLFGFFVGARFCNKHMKGRAGEVCHKIDEHLAKIREFGITAAGGPYPVWIGRDDSERASKLLTAKGILSDDKYICVSPGAKSHIKRWREGGFAGACDMLIDAFKVKIIFVGDDSDKEICERILAKMRNYAVSVAGMTDLRELVCIIKRSSLLVTNDSAPLHIAGSIGTPAVAIFGPTDPAKYGPRAGAGTAVFKELHCSPCETALCRYNLECMKAVSADEVFDAAKKILDERK
ncbi:MAG: glycosyltransferase family 9 protein [Candidatus Omnitrophica bacterium]|nr:glycosyltransferase family 9 protein [Candidatus Omnitrophota bacterium]MDD5310824.1 glycosyltransferase family 9 protein [Candidatus Omnitrophota bacterium]MDD5546791.1 glycosyltransferase family 9 protein [Candidatus Omnitrophota bacterium]